jgi:hypothetical protein
MEESYNNYDYDYRWENDEIDENFFGRIAIQERIKGLQGRILTIVEATTPDKEQRNSLKSVISQEFSRELRYFTELALDRDGKPKGSATSKILHSYSEVK